ncbi:OmpA family protein [Novosphingobium kaempferiae]|uniref:OmpA family protein n=1 Tax=Novosphingobium kaempferiae TaxID=2896849 RepID=UPI001E5DF0E9|nr:OmpA family protein [Novosphingobium kaempferiae]
MGKSVRAVLFCVSCVIAPGSVAHAQDTEALSERDVDCFVAGCDEDAARCEDAAACPPADNGMPSMTTPRPFALPVGGDKGGTSTKAARPPARRSLDMRIQFELGSYELTPRARANADLIARALSADRANRVFTIAGHTDAIGNAAYNRQLSRDRAQAVTDYLIGKGVPPGKVRTVGYGFSRPLGNRAATDPANRRVEIVRQ